MVEDLLRDPYVLEFAGLAERPEYSEDELETALLDHLQRFLLGGERGQVRTLGSAEKVPVHG